MSVSWELWDEGAVRLSSFRNPKAAQRMSDSSCNETSSSENLRQLRLCRMLSYRLDVDPEGMGSWMDEGIRPE